MTEKVHRLIGSEQRLTWSISFCKYDFFCTSAFLVTDSYNFKMQSAGSQKIWIERDVDLDALCPSELDDMVSCFCSFSLAISRFLSASWNDERNVGK